MVVEVVVVLMVVVVGGMVVEVVRVEAVVMVVVKVLARCQDIHIHVLCWHLQARTLN